MRRAFCEITIRNGYKKFQRPKQIVLSEVQLQPQKNDDLASPAPVVFAIHVLSQHKYEKLFRQPFT